MWKFIRLAILALILLPFLLLGQNAGAKYLPDGTMDGAPMSVNITITVYPLVPPTVTNDGGATNVLDVSARLNGEITSTGNENPVVTVFWGAIDGGTTAANWTSNSTLGAKPLGTFYKDVGGLAVSTTYYYRCYAANSAGSDWAPSTANFTTVSGILRAPTGLTLTDLGGYTVTANWTKGAFSTYTLLRISRKTFPPTITTDEWLYYDTGTSVNITGWPMDTQTLYVSAWGFAADNVTYSSGYATDSIGGDGMTEIGTALTKLSDTFGGIYNLLYLAGGMVLILVLLFASIWKKEPFIYGVTSIITIFIGYVVVKIYAPIGVCILALSSYELFEAMWLAFFKQRESDKQKKKKKESYPNDTSEY